MGHANNNKASSAGVIMIPKIKDLQALNDYKLKILFDDGRRVVYDVNDDIEKIEDFKQLKNQLGLWNCVQLDQSKTCVFWNDRIDLPSDTLYEFGIPID